MCVCEGGGILVSLIKRTCQKNAYLTYWMLAEDVFSRKFVEINMRFFTDLTLQNWIPLKTLRVINSVILAKPKIHTTFDTERLKTVNTETLPKQ